MCKNDVGVADLYEKLKEIEAQIQNSLNADGSPKFGTFKVMVSLELVMRMIKGEVG
jgi:hypothetical protein